MNPALWISKTGLDAQTKEIAVISNNLANASTIGFKKSRAVFEDLLYQNINQPGGVCESRPYEMAVRTVDEFKNVDDLQNVVIRSNFSGQAVRIKDIAKIDDTFGQPKVITRTNGRPSIILVVRKKEFSDIIQVTASLKKELSDFILTKYESEILDYRKETQKDMKDLLSNQLVSMVSNSILPPAMVTGIAEQKKDKVKKIKIDQFIFISSSSVYGLSLIHI